MGEDEGGPLEIEEEEVERCGVGGEGGNNEEGQRGQGEERIHRFSYADKRGGSILPCAREEGRLR